MNTKDKVRSMRNLAVDVNNYFSGKRVCIIGMDYSGKEDLNVFLEALEKYTSPGFFYSATAAEMGLGLDEKFGEHRVVRGLDEIDLPERDIDAYVAFENSALKTGRSAASGPICMAYSLHSQLPAKEDVKIYLCVSEDSIGIGNFVAKRYFRRYGGIKRFIKQNMKRTYLDMSERGLLELLSSRSPVPTTKISRYPYERENVVSIYSHVPDRVAMSEEGLRRLHKIKRPPVAVRPSTTEEFVGMLLRGRKNERIRYG